MNTLDFLEIEDIKEDILITKDKILRILKVYPINYDLKSEFEKQSIINSYKTVFKTCDFDFQILILSKKENININIKLLENNLNFNLDLLDKEKLFEAKNNNEIKLIKKRQDKLNCIYNNYINFIQNLNYDENITSKAFYIILYEKRIDKNQNKNIIFKALNIKINKKVRNQENQENINKVNNLNKNKIHIKDIKKENMNKYIKNLNEKEKRIINSLSKCGNYIKRIRKEEIYELFKLSKKGSIDV